MRRCKCCGELSLPLAGRCVRCGSKRLEWEIAVKHLRVERAVGVCLAIAILGALATVVGHSMLHTGTGPHTWACAFLIGGIAIVSFAAMVLTVFALLEDERTE